MQAITVSQLLEAGVHFGHHPRRWNPKMKPWIFGVRSNVHILNLQKTAPLFNKALAAIRDTVGSGGRVLFVGTKRQAADIIALAAQKSGQHFINHRWLGGMLTNWKTVSQSIRRLKMLDDRLSKDTAGLTKKELLMMQRDREKLQASLGGIREMGGVPDILFVIDTMQEALAIQEANKIGIPVVAVIDSNGCPDGVTYPIPGNDDAKRAIELYCNAVVDAILEGVQIHLKTAGVDLKAMERVSEKVTKDLAKEMVEVKEVAEVVQEHTASAVAQ